jgi:hypothetical protein
MSNLQLSFIFFMRLESFHSCTFLPVSKAHANKLCNSTASSTSDVSCRSNPDVPSYSSNTNMSSQISAMFYKIFTTKYTYQMWLS